MITLKQLRYLTALAEHRHFGRAADACAVSQPALSMQIRGLEKDLGVWLFTRTARGAELTVDGRAFLPHARELLQAQERAAASVRPGRRALRVDVISRRIGPAALLRGFHRAHPGTGLDVVTLFDAETAVAAVRSGAIDATFRAVTARQLPHGIRATRVLDEPHQLLIGPGHALASARTVTLAELAGHRIWIPGIVAGTEWAAYYDELAAAFGLTIDAVGPNFGTESLLDVLADTADLASLVGEQTRLLWPAEFGLRRIAVRDPVPVYPHSLIWRNDNPHPALATLRDYLAATRPRQRDTATWAPGWARD